MGYLLFILFVAFFLFALWRSFAVSLSVHDGRKVDFSISRGLPFLLVAVLIFIFWLSFTTVDAGYRGVVLRFGALTGRTLEPGPHLIIPVFETVKPISVQVQVEKLDSQAASHDLQVVHTQVTLAYYQDPCCVTDIWAKLNDDALDRVVIPAIQEAIKAQTAQFDAEQLVAQRAVVRNGIEQYVRDRLTTHHIDVDAVSITDFNFSDEYNRAIEAKVTAQQNALKAENDLTRIKIEAEQKVTQAQAEAKALEVQKQQITPELIELRTIEMMTNRWDGHLPDVYMAGNSGGALPMIDVLKAAGKTK
ncbi:MAG TPA: prohibitin family protein [Candidatus Acidoferrales bacterium]|nr:prohibitin family protein [Candidatus Acidoferrales bacterium]